jgi:hypothetical protein
MRREQAHRRGKDLPPIRVYRNADRPFVRDGPHRVSVARALGLTHIDAYVTEVYTQIGADQALTLQDLPTKSHERLFYERVPLPPEARKEIELTDAWRYAELAEGVEAWGFRYMQGRGELLDRAEVAETWLEEEYRPVVAMLKEADLIGAGRTATDAYMRLAADRFRLLRTHEWNDEVIERLRREQG